MKQSVFTVSMLLLLLSSGHAQSGASSKLPSHIYGEWKINKFVEVGGHSGASRDDAEKQIGKRLKIERQSFTYDDGFLWFESSPCTGVQYEIEAQESKEREVRRKGSLAFYGLEAAQDNRSQFVIVTCGKRRLYYFELAKEKELAVYYDGWFFFLKKTTST